MIVHTKQRIGYDHLLQYIHVIVLVKHLVSVLTNILLPNWAGNLGGEEGKIFINKKDNPGS